MNIHPFIKFLDRKQPVLPVRRAKGKQRAAFITSCKSPPLPGLQADQGMKQIMLTPGMSLLQAHLNPNADTLKRHGDVTRARNARTFLSSNDI